MMHINKRFLLTPGGVLILISLSLLPYRRGSAQAPGYADISSPADGQAIQGLFTIEGSASHPFFESYDLAFAYQNDPTQTWFMIADTVTQPVANGPLALWDTSGLTDGNYRLRLRVFLTNGNILPVIIENVRVRNYSAVETSAPGAAPALATASPVVPTPTPRPTPLPALSGDGGQTVYRAFTLGAVFGSVVLVTGGAYIFMRRQMQIRLGMMQMRRMLWKQDRRQRRQK
jgi:hypothetical protein